MQRTYHIAVTLVIAGGVAYGLTWRADPLDRIQHIVVISQENWSFDGLYGHFPGANGIADANHAYVQLERDDILTHTCRRLSIPSQH